MSLKRGYIKETSSTILLHYYICAIYAKIGIETWEYYLSEIHILQTALFEVPYTRKTNHYGVEALIDKVITFICFHFSQEMMR